MKTSKDLFLIPKLLMITAGTWELELVGSSELKKKFYKVYSIIMFVAYHTSHVSFSIKFIELLGGDSIEKVVESASMIIIVFLLAIKMALCRRKQMTEVLDNAIKKKNTLLNDENGFSQKIYSGYFRYALIINISLTAWSFFVGLFLTVGGSFDYFKPSKDLTLNYTVKELKPLHVLLWYPFDQEEYYGLVIFYEFFSILFSDLYNSCLQSLLNTMMIQIAADLKILQYNFRSVGSGKETAYEDFKRCAKRYQEVIVHTTELNKALRYTLLIEYVVSSIMLASILVQILSGKKAIFNTFYFGILAFQWCLLAWNANEIKQQSEKLAMSIYESNWYEHTKPTNQLAFITVLRTRRPLYLTIGPFGEMSINTAISTLKLAYSYVSIMS
ncbi:odorant receptor Or2-like [Anthonomus grandis grandis]|uniref:odorant receptor Or2-like n=1 Tax=Anthonomus grandis grandis TaxID=2921223 RepID=UPI00216554E1|nr:odorant receptor Or2-like [Anthonomus grandis grandis]XP_050296910.1 odorant receptor Or2-like [Anthonomus grandis grandis]